MVSIGYCCCHQNIESVSRETVDHAAVIFLLACYSGHINNVRGRTEEESVPLPQQLREDKPMGEKTMEIFLHDLVPETQKEILKLLGLETPEDGNLDTVPLATVTAADIGEAKDENEGGPDNVQSQDS